ncbi:L-lysine-epsilon aminotransferase [compost metagenome]
MQVCGILAGGKVDEIETNVFNVPSRINSTWGGNLADMVRSTKVLQIIEEDNLLSNSTIVGNYLHERLFNIAEHSSIVSNVRGRGLMNAFDFPNKEMRDKFIKQGMEYNTMFLGCGDRSIRFRPALMMEQKHIDEGMETVATILNNM